MTGLLDTSVILRYLVDAPPELATRATHILDQGSDLWITDSVLAETVYVLMSFYRAPRAEVVDRAIELVRKRNVSVVGLPKFLVIQALLMCRPSGRISLPDALTWAWAHATGHRLVCTFDRQFPAQGIDVRGNL